MKEEWRPITLYADVIPSDKYQVSNIGRIRDMYRNGKICKLQYNLTRPTCLLTNRPVNDPDEYKQKFVYVARCVAYAFIPLPRGISPRGLSVIHKDDDVTNNHVANLKWAFRMGNGHKMDIDKYIQVLELVRQTLQDHTITETSKIVSQYSETPISPETIRSWTAVNKDGTMKFMGYETLGIEPIHKERIIHKIPEEHLHEICKLLVAYNGNVTKTCFHLPEHLKYIRSQTIYHIRNKDHYTQISDQYFEYYGKDEFYPK